MNWIDNGVTRFLGKVADFMFLNLLWIVCSIPIITIGASTTAMYSVMLKLVKNEEGYIVKGFLKAFKENFRQSTLMWLLYLVFGIVIVVDFMLLRMMSPSIRTVMQVFLIFMTILLISMGIYGFALQARYENPIKNNIEKCIDPYRLQNAIYTFDAGHYSSTGSCDISDSADVDVRFSGLAVTWCFFDSVA